MSIKLCERCGERVYKIEKCNYCGKEICFKCVKSSRNSKTGYRVICKDCWCDTDKKKKYLSD